MRICVVGGMIDIKLKSKIAPLQHSDSVSEIHLIRRNPYTGNKINCHSVPRWARHFLPLAELWRLTQLFWICLRYRPKVLIAFGTTPHGVYIWLAGKIFRIKTIQHIMGKNDLRLTFPNQRGRKITLRAVRAANLVAVRGSPMIEYLVQQGIQREKLFIPQNIHDFSLFTPSVKDNPEYELIYVGLLARYKRIDLLLESFAATDPVTHNKKLLLVGGGAERLNLEQQAIDLGIKQQVVFAGAVEFIKLPGLYHQAQTFIMTSQGEGLPMAMIEAMSCGLPTIIANDADITEIARHDINALVVDDWTVKCFSDAIITLRHNPEHYQQLKNNALKIRELKQTEYSLEAQTLLWTEKLNSLFN